MLSQRRGALVADYSIAGTGVARSVPVVAVELSR